MEEIRLLESTDGMVWAQEFVRIYNSNPNLSITQDRMLAWFTSAIETGRNAGEKSLSNKIEEDKQSKLDDVFEKGYFQGVKEGTSKTEEKYNSIEKGKDHYAMPGIMPYMQDNMYPLPAGYISDGILSCYPSPSSMISGYPGQSASDVVEHAEIDYKNLFTSMATYFGVDNIVDSAAISNYCGVDTTSIENGNIDHLIRDYNI